MDIYCLKCKKHVECVDGEKQIMKNGRPAFVGKCPTCGSKISRFLKVEAAATS